MDSDPVQKNKILFLGPKDPGLIEWIEHQGDPVIQTTDRISAEFIDTHRIFFVISYGYKHILAKPVLEKLSGNAVNLHISYLPWNRGADPNFWSFADKTPKGVTIHYIDSGIDTGDIIVQKELYVNDPGDTLATTYHRLKMEITVLFKENWESIKTGNCHAIKQSGKGSFHRTKDKEPLWKCLPDGWDTPVETLENIKKNSVIDFGFQYDREN